MKIVTAKKIAVLLVLALYGRAVEASEYERQNCAKEEFEFVCACNPLYCGAKSVQFHTGVAPIIWKGRGQVDLVSCTSSPTNPIFQLSSSFPKFKKLFEIPWIIGGIVGYALTDNVELYAEFNYLQAHRKNHLSGFSFVIPNITPTQSVTLVLGRYKLFDAYFGIRYYWDRWCEHISPFLGAKMGATIRRGINTTVNFNGVPLALSPVTVCVPTINTQTNLFSGKTVFTSGINGGFDICFCGNWSFVITGEVVICTGPRVQTALAFATLTPAPLLASNLIVGPIDTELRFPVTAALKYNF